jgi:sporulation protein YlmC with PRC-barrel domain
MADERGSSHLVRPDQSPQSFWGTKRRKAALFRASPRRPTLKERANMRKIISATAATVFAMGVSVVALAQQPALVTSGSAKIFGALPAGTTVTNFYKQNVYDPSDNKIGDIDDVLIDKAGNVSALIVSVGGFLGMGEKDVAIPFSDVHATEKNNKWYLVLNTTKDALKTAPGFTYDKNRTTWIPAAK